MIRMDISVVISICVILLPLFGRYIVNTAESIALEAMNSV